MSQANFSVCGFFLLGLFFDSEDEGDIFLRNIGGLPPKYMALQA
jgi:hypothetical protein